MPTSQFIIRGTGSAKPQSITLIFRYENTHLKYATGFKVLPHLWNDQRQEVRNKAEALDRVLINNGLSSLRTRIQTIYHELVADQKVVTNYRLREKLNSEILEDQQSQSFIQDYLIQFLSKAPTKSIRKNGSIGPLKERTIKQYRTTLSKIKAFDAMNKCKSKFGDLDESFHSDFINYLKEDESLSAETIGTVIKNIKSLAKAALRESIEVNEFVLTPDFFRPTGNSVFTFLNEKEIQNIFDFDLSDNLRLDRVRDLFIVGLCTGQRISDLSRITMDNIVDGFIEIEAQLKTGTAVIIPIHPMVQHILDKYDNNLPPMISPQKFNQYSKELCKVVGLHEPTKGTKRILTKKGQRITTGIFPKHELVSSHICRRSFATNHYGHLPTPVIMSITGHKTERAFLTYIKKTPKHHAIDLKKYWDNKYRSKREVVA
ncbi:MAG: tyrosine-type recombinase/integrase [Flavobacteriales bacterium]|nr:tyrosine-type recombinase/integrase [Flavobacteriales bacterium]